jgi:hypothetical protein
MFKTKLLSFRVSKPSPVSRFSQLASLAGDDLHNIAVLVDGDNAEASLIEDVIHCSISP